MAQYLHQNGADINLHDSVSKRYVQAEMCGLVALTFLVLNTFRREKRALGHASALGAPNIPAWTYRLSAAKKGEIIKISKY